MRMGAANARVAIRGCAGQCESFTGDLMNRREFLRRSGGLAAGAVSLQAFPYHLYAAERPKQASDVVPLGATGLNVSRLAMGTGTNGVHHASDQTRALGRDGVARMFKAGFDNGVTFWDSARPIREPPAPARGAADGMPREKVTILTKTEATTEVEMRSDLDRFRQEIGTDYIDILLLHCLTEADWPERRKAVMNVLSEAREKGIVRAHGVSCRTLSGVEGGGSESDWVQVDLARVNPAGASMDADPATVLGVLREMKAKGKGVIGMKVLGAGALVNRADECFQWQLAQENVDCFTLGMKSEAELARTLRQIPAASVRA